MRACCTRSASGSACPGRRTPVSRENAARARCSSTARSCARAWCWRRRPTATRSSRSRAWPTATRCTASRRRSSRRAQCSAASARRASSSRPPTSSGTRPTRARTRSARRSPATSAAAPATRRSSTPSAWRREADVSATRPATLQVGHIGEIVPRADGIPKTTGEFAYASDLWAAGMLWGHTVRSPHAHARILEIDISQALAMPGVHAVLTHADVPGAKTYGLEFPDQPVLAIDRVRYFGEPVVLVAAEHPEQARRAAEQVRVEYEPLELVVDPERATEQEPLHPDRPTMGHGYRDDPRPNVVRHMVIRHGDPDTRGRRHGRGRLRDRDPGPGVPRPRVGAGGPGRRGRRRHLRRHAVAARRPRPGRAVPRARRPSRCASTSPASAARSAGARTSRCRSTARCSRCTRAAR